jgi:hypothetical protein
MKVAARRRENPGAAPWLVMVNGPKQARKTGRGRGMDRPDLSTPEALDAVSI